jgi:hypothetical protein
MVRPKRKESGILIRKTQQKWLINPSGGVEGQTEGGLYGPCLSEHDLMVMDGWMWWMMKPPTHSFA